jgi:hypothetical protein
MAAAILEKDAAIFKYIDQLQPQADFARAPDF